MLRLKRKIDDYLREWKDSKNKMPLIVKGARQIGKTDAIMNFGSSFYDNVVNINFALQKEYKTIFDEGFEVDKIIKYISLIDPDFVFVPGQTLIFFDEIQDCINGDIFEIF